MKDRKCSVKGCKEPANYHIANLHGNLYYCDEHWAIRLGFKKRKVKNEKTKNMEGSKKESDKKSKGKRGKKRA